MPLDRSIVRGGGPTPTPTPAASPAAITPVTVKPAPAPTAAWDFGTKAGKKKPAGGKGKPRHTDQAVRIAEALVRSRYKSGRDSTPEERALVSAYIQRYGDQLTADDARLLTAAVTPRPKPSRSVWGLVQNAAGDVVDIAMGLPHLGAAIGKTAALPVTGPYGETLGRIPGVPGGKGARDFTRRTIREDANIVRGVIEGTVAYWEPLVTGDLQEFLDYNYAHPVIGALNVGGAYRVLGAAARGSALTAVKAGVASPSSAVGQFARKGAFSELRHRDPRVLTPRLRGEDAPFPEGGVPGPIGSPITVPRRPRSPNPITAAIQRGVTDPLLERAGERVTGFLDRRLDADGLLARTSVTGAPIRRYSTQGRYERAAARDPRVLHTEELDALLRDVEDIATPYVRAVAGAAHPGRRTTGRAFAAGSPENIAINLHLKGILDQPGYPDPRAARDAAAAFYRDGIQRARAGRLIPGFSLRVRKAERNLRVLESLPDEYLVYGTLPPAMKRAVDEGRRVLDVAEDATVNTGLIAPAAVDRRDGARRALTDTTDPEEAARLQDVIDRSEQQIMEARRHSRERSAAQVHGGAEYDLNRVLPTERGDRLAAELAAEEEVLRGLEAQRETGDTYRALQAARSSVTRALEERRRAGRDTAAAAEREALQAVRDLVETRRAEPMGGRAGATAVAKNARAAARRAGDVPDGRLRALRAQLADVFHRPPQQELTPTPRERPAEAGVSDVHAHIDMFTRRAEDLEDQHVAAARRDDGRVTRYADTPLMRSARQEMADAKREASTRASTPGEKADAAYEARGSNSQARGVVTGGEREYAGASGQMRDQIAAARNDRTMIDDPAAKGGRRAKRLEDYAADVIEDLYLQRESGVTLEPWAAALLDDLDTASRLRRHAQDLREAFTADPFTGDLPAGGAEDLRTAVLGALQERLAATAPQVQVGTGDPIGPVGGGTRAGELAEEAEAALPGKQQAARRTFRAVTRQEGSVARQLERLAHQANFEKRVQQAGLLTRRELDEANKTVRALERELHENRGRTVGDADDIIRQHDVVRSLRRALADEHARNRGSWTPAAPIGVDLDTLDNPTISALKEDLAGYQARLQGLDETASAGSRGYLMRKVRGAEAALRDAQIEEAARQGHRFQAPEARYLPETPAQGRTAPSTHLRSLDPVPIPKRNKGVLNSYFNINTQPRVVVYTLLKALEAQRHPEALAKLLSRHVLTDEAGRVISGPRTANILRNNPDHVTLVNVRALRRALRRLDDLTTEEYPRLDELRGLTRGDPEDLDAAAPDSLDGLPVDQWTGARNPLDDVFLDGERAGQVLDDAGQFRPGIRPDDYVLITKAVADEWRSLSRPRRLPGFDNLQEAWKRGVLAFTPRWYFYNLVGNSLQYGLMTGGDLRSLRQANRIQGAGRASRAVFGRVDAHGGEGRNVRAAIPPRMTASTLSHETGGHGLDQVRRRVTDPLIAFNDRLENILRRAAYVNRAKKVARENGLVTRRELWSMTDQDLARLLDGMPDDMKQAALDEALHFLGDYQTFTPFERAVLKRVFPFYSWLRVVGRLTFVTPVRYPVRSMVLAQLAIQATEEEAPGDFARPWYERGGLRAGRYRLSTLGLNPFSTVAGPVAALAEEGAPGAVAELAGSASPVLRPVLGAFGVSSLTGSGITSPLGYQGSVERYGGDPTTVSPITQARRYVTPRIPLSELFLQQVPVAGNVSRALLAGQDRPYDTASTLDLARYRLPGRILGGPGAQQLFQPRRYTPATQPLPGGLSVASSLLGLPVKDHDDRAEVEMLLRQLLTDTQAARDTGRRLARQRAGG